MARPAFTTLIIIALIATIAASCKKGDQTYYHYKQVLPTFNGSALDYLKHQTGVFDSMLVVLNRFPDLQDSLANEKNITVFGVPNSCFQRVIGSLNAGRKNLGQPPVYLSNINADVLDTMICKYLVHGSYPISYLNTQTNGLLVSSIKLNYQMFLQYQVLNASGLVGEGEQQVSFFDTNNSTLQSSWVNAVVDTLDIKANNATIYVLSPGHDFDFNQFSTKFN
jgi:hypothetical protein